MRDQSIGTSHPTALLLQITTYLIARSYRIVWARAKFGLISDLPQTSLNLPPPLSPNRQCRLIGQGAGHVNECHPVPVRLGAAFVAAVQTRSDGRPLYMRLTPVADFTNQDGAQ